MKGSDRGKRLVRTFLLTLCVLALTAFLILTVLVHSAKTSEREKALIARFMESDLSVCVFSVGQADSILIRRGEEAMLIDCGDPEDADTILTYLKDMEIRDIDALILTHPHSDHIGGAQRIMESLPVGCVYMPYALTTTLTFDRLLDCILEKSIPGKTAYAGETVEFADCSVRILSPQKGLDSESLNAYSVVLLLEYDGVRMLFASDAEADNEAYILESGEDIDCDLVKVGHHGSYSSSTQAFVDACRADWAIVTTQHDSPNDLPKDSVLARWKRSGASVLCTMDCGSVYAFVRDGKLSVDCAEGSLVY